MSLQSHNSPSASGAPNLSGATLIAGDRVVKTWPRGFAIAFAFMLFGIAFMIGRITGGPYLTPPPPDTGYHAPGSGNGLDGLPGGIQGSTVTGPGGGGAPGGP
jgi:hypothetical protein